MTGHFARLAGAFILFVAGIAAAATPMLLPVALPGAKAKSTGDTAVRFNGAAISRLEPGDEVQMALPDGSLHTYLHESFVDHGGGLKSWIARSPVTGDGERAIITYGENGAWGWMATSYGQYRIYPSGEGYDLLTRKAKDNHAPKFAGGDAILVGDDPPEVAPLKGVPTFVTPLAKSTPFAKAAPTPSVQADVMFIYTRDLADKLGLGLVPMLHNLIASLNQAYADSEVALTVRLVRAHKMDYPNANGSSETLSGMRGFGTFAPLFDGISHGTNSIRDQVGADFVALLRDGPSDTGGIASLLINQSQFPTIVSTQTQAMSVNNFCKDGCQGILAHELGHNMGNHHDRATIAKDVNGANPLPQGVFPYSYGHYSCATGLTCNPYVPGGCGAPPDAPYPDCAGADASDFGTIMSYFGPKVMKFSSPNLKCVPLGGVAPGRDCGGGTAVPAPAGSSDNAASMNHVRGNVAAYRTQTYFNTPPSIQFANTAFTATETGGTITFTLSRVGGTAGAVAVTYSLASSTATAGTDFGATGGTVQWADGDGANKSFTVTIVNDGVVEGNETFLALLANPTGTPGVYLGHPTIATGLITEPWPDGGVAPPGFSFPPGPGWAVASDSTFDGTGFSWKSGALGFACPPDCGPPQPAPPPASVTEFTGNFVAGTLAFAYRVNSYPGFGFLEFLVDGTVVHSDSGDTGWKFYSTAMTAGPHTLQWRYRSALYFPCANSGLPPPQGNACADRAWIDSVALPLAPAASTTHLASGLNPSQVGNSVTFTATVTGSFGTPTGTVTFNRGATPITGCTSIPLISGSADCTTTSLASGTHSISASYSGNPTYGTSFSSAIVQVVSTGALLLTASPLSLSFGGQSMNTTSPPLPSTLTNTSGSPVTVTAVTGGGGFAATHNCGTLQPGGTCVVNVTFTPPIFGTTTAVSGAVSVEYAGGGPTAIVTGGSAERSLVTHYYRSILRRAPDSGGKTFWESEATRVANLGANINEAWFAMAQSFYFSPEYIGFNRSHAAFITDLFNTFFNRVPDAGGTYWTDQLNQGMPREVVLAGFMFSAEFNGFTQAIFGAPTTRAEVDVVIDFYRGILARLPDNGGFGYWVGRFRTAQCAGATQVTNEVEGISGAYASSPEYAARARTTGQFVGDLYNAFLRRGGDLGGVQFWINQIDSGAQTRAQVRVAFRNSAEFQGRVSAVIAQGCST